ncbi:glycoside hydrolase family 28 protein [Bacteroidales bacterium OttesenSCG-928-J19]|nr:glycoside hydrolase family 28 protein [Bacteroidales bacterium OttesenSCG-928-J19]
MNKKIAILTTVFLGLVSLMNLSPVQASNPYQAYYQSLPFEMPVIQKPGFPDRQVSVTEFGAVGDGATLNTDAFNRAMISLSEQGGGTLYVPAGVWYTIPFVFQSNVNLYLEKGALIVFNPDLQYYPLVNTALDGWDVRRAQAPIFAQGKENIAITGHGTINGSGEAWRPMTQSKLTEAQWSKVTKSGGVIHPNGKAWYPSEGALKGSQIKAPIQGLPDEELEEIKRFLRPSLVNFIDCRNILIEGVQFENSPNWTIHPLMCENIIIDGITVHFPTYAQNGHGIDIESTRNILLLNSTFYASDDAICARSGKNPDGLIRNMPTENMLVDNCKAFQGNGGLSIGSDMSGGVRNLLLRNCTFADIDYGLRYKGARGRGGVVENIYVENLSLYNLSREAIRYDMYYGGKPGGEAVLTETTPVFRNLYVKNLVARQVGTAMYIYGLPEMKFEGLYMENVFIEADKPGDLAEIDGLDFKNVRIKTNKGTNCTITNVTNFRVDGKLIPTE